MRLRSYSAMVSCEAHRPPHAVLLGRAGGGAAGCVMSCRVVFYSILRFHLLLATWPPPLAAPSHRRSCATVSRGTRLLRAAQQDVTSTRDVMRSRLLQEAPLAGHRGDPVCRASSRRDDLPYPHSTRGFAGLHFLSLLPHRLSLPPLPSIPRISTSADPSLPRSGTPPFAVTARLPWP
ncbi:hypothetical protein C8J57DRAFT_1718547 [Mycena rebaudengoi]|nr:hypothetical protein C8J57DRAFT_1718547 [Mycena rebaudengoi]